MSEAKQRILSTASDLFYRHGFHATGVDQVVEEADVAKMTLYNHFSSKDELIDGVLKLRHQRWMEWFQKRVSELGDSPTEQLLGMFDALQEWFSEEDFSGCAFINASAEYADPENPHYKQARRFKKRARLFIEELVAQTEADNTSDLAEQLLMLVEGATVLAHINGDPSAAQQAKKAAQALLKTQGVLP